MPRFLSPILSAAALCLGLALPAAASDNAELLNALHLLDYIGVDYGGAVQNGQIVSEAEYTEQVEFAAEVGAILTRLGAGSGLQAQASELQAAIAEKAPADTIRTRTANLSQALFAKYPVTMAPKRAPDVAAAETLFQQQCASCHGAQGRGDGPAGANLDPPPANFHDPERQRLRSVFALYNTLNTGVIDAGMPSFAHLPEEQRWALAFYISQLIYGESQRRRGADLWKDQAAPARAIADLSALTSVEPQAFEAQFGADGLAVLAHLRAHPQALEKSSDDALAIAGTQLDASLDAYRAGRADEALQLAVSAYLDGFELAEAQLATANAPLMRRIEQAMMDFRGLVRTGAPLAEVERATAELHALLDEARSAVEGGAQSATGSFIGSFVILAREGLEAILVLAAMFAFLRKTGRADALPYVHAGWVGALLLGLATWAASNWVVNISGAGREVTEGFTALLAAAILLSVGLWMHNKSYSNRWQQYVASKMKGALANSRPWGLALLAFIAVYREVFETVLFYRALWGQGDHLAIVLGFVAAAVLLLVVTWAVFRLSMRLPLKEFFRWSSGLIVVLAVIFTGKGVAALQEAGWLSAQAVEFVRVPLLGIYPNLQGLLLQAAVLLLVLGGFGWNHLQSRRAAAD